MSLGWELGCGHGPAALCDGTALPCVPTGNGAPWPGWPICLLQQSTDTTTLLQQQPGTGEMPFHNSSLTAAVGNCLSTIPLLQQQLGSGEMPFQLFLCRGVIYSGYPRGNPGYLLLLIPGEQTPGWEGFLTLQETSPPPRANPTREEQHSPQELSISAERGEGTAHLHRAPSLPQSRRTPFRAGWPEQWFQSPSITNPPPLTVTRQDSGY